MPIPIKFDIVNIGYLSANKFWGESERVRAGTATCTLLRAGDRTLLVDPSPYPEQLEPMLFARSGLRPGDIAQVYLTHFHGDHRFGLALFPQAEWLIAQPELEYWQQRSPQDAAQIERFLSAEDKLPEGIQLFPAPGHTPTLHGLQIETRWGPLIVAGDAVMTEEFFEAEEGYHNSTDFAQASETIRVIKRAVRLVIPGHGNLILNY